MLLLSRRAALHFNARQSIRALTNRPPPHPNNLSENGRKLPSLHYCKPSDGLARHAPRERRRAEVSDYGYGWILEVFDRLTSEEVFNLLAGHHSSPKQDGVEKAFLPKIYSHYETLSAEDHPYPKEEVGNEGSWIFEDDNSATHLIKNSLGGADRELRQQLLSLRKPGVRAARDDTTVVVLWFDEKGPREERGDMTSV